MKKLISVNFVFSILKFLFNIIIIKLADIFLSAPEFNFLLYLRRTAPILGNILQLGFSQAVVILLPRKHEGSLVEWYEMARALISAIAVFSLIMALLFHQNTILIFATATIAVDYTVRSLMLARLLIVQSNLIEIFVMGFPLIILITLNNSHIESSLLINYTLCLVILILCFKAMINNIKLPKANLKNTKLVYLKLRNRIQFGLPRSISGILELSITSLPIFILGVNQSVNLNIASSYTRLSLFFITPLMEILQIKINQMIGHEMDDRATKMMHSLTKMFIPITVVVSLLIKAASSYILPFWVTNNISINLSLIVELTILSVPGMTIYALLKVFIDSIYKIPFSSYFALTANIIPIAVALISQNEYATSVAISFSYFILGFLMITTSFKKKGFYIVVEYCASLCLLLSINIIENNYILLACIIVFIILTLNRSIKIYGSDI